MAAGTFTAVETVRERLKLTVNDSGGDSSDGAWLTNDQYDSFIYDHVVEDATTFNFKRRGTGLWTADGGYWGGKPYVLLFSNTTLPFAVAADCTYKITCWGSMTQATGTDDTTSSYTCPGLRVNFPQMVSDLCLELATHRSITMSETTGIAPDVIARHFLHMGSVWKS